MSLVIKSMLGKVVWKEIRRRRLDDTQQRAEKREETFLKVAIEDAG